MKYREKLPENCPPSDAEEITAPRTVFRLVDSNPPEDRDFWSWRAIHPKQFIDRDECTVRGVSVCSTRQAADNRKKLPNLKGKIICQVQLERGAGNILHEREAHSTWWPLADFNILAHCTIKLK